MPCDANMITALESFLAETEDSDCLELAAVLLIVLPKLNQLDKVSYTQNIQNYTVHYIICICQDVHIISIGM